jgi:hypothetical protein
LNILLKKLSFIVISLLIGTLISGITLSTKSVAGESINKSLRVESKGSLFVKIPRGVVTIKGWDKAEIMVEGELDDMSNRLVFETQKDKTVIKIDTQGLQTWGDSSVITIYMPQQLKLQFKGIDTSFRVTNLLNEIEGKSINGNLMVTKSKGSIKLSVVSGDVAVLESSGFIKVETVSGTIDFSGDFQQAYLKTVSGELVADITGTDKLMIKNISGDSKISGRVKSKAIVKLSSVSGNILYTVSGILNAECEVISQLGGDIDNQLTADIPIKGNLNKKTLRFISGDGSGALSLNTINGSVFLNTDK